MAVRIRRTALPSGLVALLDDVSLIARAAAASIDDVGIAATKAGTKAAGVVIDDAAVTPSYVTNFTPDRELPIIWAIAKGSLRNKLLFLLPGALLLSAFLPWAITPLLMLGGLFLCYEGAEKLIEKLGGAHHGETLADPIEDVAEFERNRIAGAIRTDLILSAEIMAIALAEVDAEPLVTRGIILALVGVVITVLVYGAVALIVKMDDVGLHLSARRDAGSRGLGRLLLLAMPRLLTFLSVVGTAAMLWVGGGIILHGLEELGVHGPAEVAHGIQHWVEEATGALAGVLGWLSYAVVSALVGVILGAIVVFVLHKVLKLGHGKAH
jgi:predicted DNA repair protein MutK